MSPAERAATGALQDLRVLELGTVVAGPFAGRLLADMGADVVKVESPTRPDPLRDWGQESYKGERLWWTVHARNKRCVTLDLRSPEGQDVLLQLVSCCDIVVENFRPGTLERWNLGYERLRTARPDVILCRVSGYGQTGPYSSRAGYASVAEAMGGLRAINGYPDQPPPRMGISLGDSLGGMFAVQGILAALHHRSRTGEGQVVDVALTEACLALLESTIPEYDRLGRVRQPSGTGLEGIAPSNLFRSKDDTWLIIAANQDTVFRRLCDAMGRPELAADPRFVDHIARGDHQAEIESIVAGWAAQRDAAEITEVLDAAGVIVGSVYTAADIVADPHFRARDMLVPHHDPRLDEDVLGPGIVPKLSATPGSVRWAGPATPGAHNEAVYSDLLGLSPKHLKELSDHGVI